MVDRCAHQSLSITDGARGYLRHPAGAMMAISLLQKLKLGLRGWNRRRAESAARRDEDFVARSTPWAKVAPAPETRTNQVVAAKTTVDLEGLQVAYLEGSGAIEHYFDTQTGEVVELRDLD